MARRGRDTLAFGPLKPVGLVDPRTGRRPHAVVQLRQEDREGTLWNLVGCQTKLRIGEQKRIFRALPGLDDAVFARFGSIHRNTYVNAPLQLDEQLQLKKRPGVYLAGQMAGVEGYVESAALGYLAGVGVARRAQGLSWEIPPAETAHGALLRHLQNADSKHFQPMNINYGLFPPLDRAVVESALIDFATQDSLAEGDDRGLGAGQSFGQSAASDHITKKTAPKRGRRRKLPKREKNELLAARALDKLSTYCERVRPPDSRVV
jgi:tRNA:m(5)U-54 methyltransferase